MELTSREENELVRQFEPLVKTTARQLVTGEHPTMAGMPRLELEEDDVAQLLRMKVLYGIRKFDGSRCRPRKPGKRSPLERWVFSVVYDCCKDIAKKRRRFDVMLEDLTFSDVLQDEGEVTKALIRRGHVDFEQRHLSASAEESSQGDPTYLLNGLEERERVVAGMLYEGFSQTEIMSLLGISKREIEGTIRSTREKLDHLRVEA